MAEEKRFENRIKAHFESIGVYPSGYGEDRMNQPAIGWYTKIWGGGYQKSGIPDLIACIMGEFVAVEIKATEGHPSDLQKLNVQRIRDAGGQAVILYPSGFENFKYDVDQLILSLALTRRRGNIYELKEVYK